MEFCQSGPGMAAEGDRTLVSLGEEDLTGRALTGATDGDRIGGCFAMSYLIAKRAGISNFNGAVRIQEVLV